MNQIRLTSYGWDKIISFALQSLGPLIPAAFLVIGTKSSAKAWSCLKKTYANASRSQILNLKTTLARTNMDTMSVSEYLMTIKHMADELALIGASLSEDEILLHVLNGLSPKYKELGVVMCVRDTPISFEELHDKLIEHEIYLKRDMEMKENFNATAQYNQRTSNNRSHNSNLHNNKGNSSSFKFQNSNQLQINNKKLQSRK